MSKSEAGARVILKEMQTKGIEPNVVSYSTLMSLVEFGGQGA